MDKKKLYFILVIALVILVSFAIIATRRLSKGEEVVNIDDTLITEPLANLQPNNIQTYSPVFDVQICDDEDCNIDALIVYSKFDENHNKKIYFKNLETGDIELLTDTGSNSAPKWSPDGQHILYMSWSEENSFDVFMMNKDGSNKKAVIASSADEGLAEWSPDGRKIVFESDQDGNAEIYILDLEAEEIKKLTNSTKYSTLPSWSFDGTRIAYQSSEGGAGRSQIFVMNADGTNKKQLTEYDIAFFDGDPNWCPNDTCILFERYIAGTPKIMRLNLQDLSVTPFFNNTFEKDEMEIRVSISPSGKYMAFVTNEMSYALDFEKNLLYPLEAQALDISIYP